MAYDFHFYLYHHQQLMNCNMKISVMAALFLTFLACLAIAAQARTLSSENFWNNKISMIIDYGRPVPSIPSPPQLSPTVHELTTTNYERTKRTPPPSPKLSPSEGQLQTGSPCVVGNLFSSSSSRPFLTTENGYGKAKLSLPPSSASSKSLTQLKNIASPSVAGNPCRCSFIAMETDYGRKKPSTPPPPTSSKSPTHSEIDSPYVACSCRGQFIAINTDYGREISRPPPPAPSKSPVQLVVKAELSPPPPSVSSKSPTQSGNIDSPFVDGTGNPCSSFISMVTNQDYGRTKRSPPSSPEASPRQHYDLTSTVEELNHFLRMFI